MSALEEDSMKIVFGLDGDEEIPVVGITPPGGDVENAVRQMVGVGYRYYVFASIPFDFSNGIACDFSESATCSSNPAVNNGLITAMLETPPLDMISAP